MSERRRWSARVVQELAESVGAFAGVTFEIHAGSDYRDHGLVEGVLALGGRVEVPTRSMSQGAQLAFYNRDRPPVPSPARAEPVASTRLF
jgi:hypothetical protein